MLALMAGVTAAALWLGGSKFGYGLRAIGENHRPAEASGVDIHRLDRRVYVGSAFVIALVGGLGTPFGPVLGAAFLTLASELLGTRFVYHYLIAIGVIIVAISLFLPTGLAGLAQLWRGRRAPGRA